jgi:hypothetical protein
VREIAVTAIDFKNQGIRSSTPPTDDGHSERMITGPAQKLEK